jgi:hypothetical protein
MNPPRTAVESPAVRRSAGFQTCRIADFQIGRVSRWRGVCGFGNPRYSRLGSLRYRIACEIFGLACLFLAAAAPAADEFGDISVSADAIYTGNTYHGYAEMRIVVENRADTKTHVVTLVYPNQNALGNSGNYISRLARSVSLPAGAREVVPLLQPPLPVRGDGSIRVIVDGHHEGEVRAPNAHNHCNYYTRGGGQMATVLVSRSLDYDAVAHLFESATAAAATGRFTADKAIGPPDAVAGSYDTSCWMPDMRMRSRTNWLELDYATPQPVTKVIICACNRPIAAGSVTLRGATGTNLAVLPVATGSSIPTPSGTGWETEISVPATREPVKTVRLDFPPPQSVLIDAVQITGPAGTQWASAARASSENSAGGFRSRPSLSGVEGVECLRAESPVPEWSEDWLAYSPFDAVVLNAADVAALPPAIFTALGDYVAAGGNLVVLGETGLPAAWHPVRIKKMPDGAESEIGFGSAFALTAESPSALNEVSVKRLREVVRDTGRYFQNLPADAGAANNVLPVVENLKLPTRGVVIVMLAFVVLIGPVNIIYLNRIHRRTWLLWTIPAISLVTTLLVFAYSLLREGITPDTRIRGLTVLDQTSHQAATIGAEAFYCPLTPSGGLHFDLTTEATPLVNVDFGSGTSREVDWTQSQHFERGWVSAHAPAHFHLRKSETRRERIQLLNEGGKMQIINSLGAPIKTLWVVDADLNCFAANHVAAGDKAPLGPLTSAVAARGGPGALLRDLGFAGLPGDSGDALVKYLQPNTYIAVLEGNPFLENALGSASSPRRTQSSCIVFGILEPAEVNWAIAKP